MKTNQKAIVLIKQYEGLRLTPYKDPVGKRTIGYGHLIRRGESFSKLTRAQAESLLRQDLIKAEQTLAHYVRVKLSANQHGALVSWIFNLGAGNFRTSTLRKRLNAKEFHRVPGEMLRWVLAGGKPLSGLIARRADEAKLFIR
jgi:lysozyme